MARTGCKDPRYPGDACTALSVVLAARGDAAGARRPGLRFRLGALVTLRAGDKTLVREIRTNGSVLTAHDPAAFFGIGPYDGPAALEVRWPDGTRQAVPVPKWDALQTLQKP